MSDKYPERLSVGVTLDTRETRRWSPERRAENDARESRLIFAGFSQLDEGRSRRLIAECHGPDGPAMAAEIVRRWNAHKPEK